MGLGSGLPLALAEAVWEMRAKYSKNVCSGRGIPHLDLQNNLAWVTNGQHTSYHKTHKMRPVGVKPEPSSGQARVSPLPTGKGCMVAHWGMRTVWQTSTLSKRETNSGEGEPCLPFVKRAFSVCQAAPWELYHPPFPSFHLTLHDHPVQTG